MPEMISIERRSTSPRLIILLFALCALVRLFLPTLFNDSMGFYSATSWAAIEQQNWGKQVLAGVMEYSPLPAGIMILLSPLSLISFLTINVASMLIAVSQAAVFVIIFLLVSEFCRQLWLRLVLSCLLLSLIGVGFSSWVPGVYLLNADPFWTLLIPLGLMLLFAARLGRVNSLRPVLGFSLACGVMVFSGPAGFILGLAALLTLVFLGRKELKSEGGTVLLAFMPFIYGVILHLLFNLVIMGDLFFSIRRLYPYFQGDAAVTLFESWRLGCALFWVALLIGSLFVVRQVPFFVRVVWGLSMACAPIFLIRRYGSFHIGGEYLFCGLISVGLIIALIILVTMRGLTLKCGLPAIAFCILLLCSVGILRRYSTMHESYLNDERPSGSQIVTYIDSDWKGSRVLVFGARAATMYCLADSNNPTIRGRFIGNVDFNMSVVAEHMEKEQLHLLIPPDNGRYYPQGDNFFSNLYRKNEPSWLHLERVWNGWQLWRCVRKLPQQGTL